MDLIIFDLDGTLIDSKLDLALAVNATRVGMGLEELPNELITTYVGNGAPMLIRRAFGAESSDDALERALKYFLEYYGEHCLENTRAYAGIPEALDAFARRGSRMAVLTNKPTPMSVKILEGLGLAPRFARIYGGNSFEQKKPNPIGVDTLLAELNCDRGRTVMVGDSSVDIRTARNAGILSCGVTWGFQPESLDPESPDIIVNRPDELFQAIIERITKS